MSCILVSGANGLIGSYLKEKLNKKGHDILIADRFFFTTQSETSSRNSKGQICEEADYIIHLAGENIGSKRWTNKRKKEIIDSRVNTAEFIFNNIKDGNNRLKAFISASAIGYYGAITSDKVFSENDLPANDFLGKTCRQWEQAADKFQGIGIRTVKIRTGIVLTEKKGALAKIIMLFKIGFGSALGSGKQYMPWIHIEDLCKIYIKAIEDAEMDGVYNAVAPENITYNDFVKTIAKVLNKSLWLPNIPSLLIKIGLGKMSEMILNGSKVSSKKIIEAGFKFQYPDLQTALEDLLIKHSKS